MRVLALVVLLAPVSARAENLDPLARQIMSARLRSADGGITGATRLGSGEAIPLIPSLDIALEQRDALRDAVADPGALKAPKAAPGLWTKRPAKGSKAKAHKAVDQLKAVSSGRSL